MSAIPREQMVVEYVQPGRACGPAEQHWISKAGGLTQFGAFVEMLPPGSCSSLKHWHSAEDEMVLVLEGEVALNDGDKMTMLCAGDAAASLPGTRWAIIWKTPETSHAAILS